MPLYLNPVNYMKHHLFECKIIHDGKDPFKFITMNDINVYPLNSGLTDRVEKLLDDSYDLTPEDEKLIRDTLSKTDLENYDLEKPLSQNEKNKIFRPFEFRGNSHYCLITELKKTHTEDSHQEIHFYGSPSVGYGYEDAKFQGVSQATYSFKIDEGLVDSTLKDKIKIDEVDKEDIETYSRKFKLREAERYFFRDSNDEANVYNFSIKSNHYYDSSMILKVSLRILIQTCENFKLQIIEYLKENNSRVSVEEYKENIYHIEVENESHTLGNLYQSHMMRRIIDDKTLINLIGYKKPHPLEDSIQLFCSLNPKHKVCKMNETHKFQKITSFLMEQLDEIMNELKVFLKTSEKSFN